MSAVTATVDGNVGVLTLNRPEKFNCISKALVRALNEGMDALESNPEVRAIVVRGEGKVFCTGADLTEILETREDQTSLHALLSAWQVVEARTKLEALLKKSPGDVNYRFAKARLLYLEGKYREAVETLDALAADGRLIKRPFVIAPDKQVLVGFKPEVWQDQLKG
mgnify:CR=1 FL=1